MARLLKFLMFLVAGVVALAVVGIVAVMLLFDPNDYRDEIEQAVESNTGRELRIEGDLGLSVFPWLAVELGPTALGNAAGFGAEPFARFESARLSVRLLPALLHRKFEVSTVSFDGLLLNLQVNSNGRSNWQDFIDAAEARASMEQAEAEDPTEPTGELDIQGVEISNSVLRYRDAQDGSDVSLTNLNVSVGNVSAGEDSFHIDGFDIDALLEGAVSVPTTLALETDAVDIDTSAETITLADVDLDLLGMDISAIVEPFSYAGDITPVAKIEVDAFSLRNLMERLDMEAPPTSNSAALGKVIIEATARRSATAITMTDLTLVLDDTTFTGELSIPQGDNDIYRIELRADRINLDDYMAPPSAGGDDADAEEPPVEIPADLIRVVNAEGSLRIDNVQLGGMQFDNVNVGLKTNAGKLRLHPLTAELFGGKYNGDVRIDASGSTPLLTLNERVEGVQLGELAVAMYDRENVSGTINGTFQLSGRGADIGVIRRDLDGNIAFELVDGAYEGKDVWHELRTARAKLRQEPAPEAEEPARTRFSEVRASGPVKDGIFSNNDFTAEMPFMRLTGEGTVNFIDATLDYGLSARVLDKPELVGDEITAEELKDLTEVVIPMRVTGPLTDPSVRPDVQKLVRERAKKEVDKAREKVEEKVKDKLKELLNN